LTASISFAQINIQPLPVASFSFKSEDVWNLSVVNASEQSFKAYFNARITNGQELVHLKSEQVTISPGQNVFTSALLRTSDKRYLSAQVSEYELLTGQLPLGNYTYCVELVCIDQNCFDVIGRENVIKVCNTIIKPNSTPLLLSSPDNKSKIKNTRPDLTWIAPMPIGTDPNLTYTLTLVELLDGQGPVDGLKRNRALYKGHGLKGTVLAFPPELEDLKQQHRYGWQVEARIGNNVVAVSDAWEFEIDEEIEELNPMPYVRLKRNDAAVYNAVNNLRFIYKESLRRHQMNVRFFDERGKDVTPKGVVFPTTFGDNKFNLDLKQFDFVNGHQYRMVVTSSSGEEYSLKFKYVFQFTD
jgi:hypothetical protein